LSRSAAIVAAFCGGLLSFGRGRKGWHDQPSNLRCRS